MFPVENFLTDYEPVSPETRERMDHIRDLYADLVRAISPLLPSNAERTAGMRKLLEAKDCHVRALIQGEREGGEQ